MSNPLLGKQPYTFDRVFRLGVSVALLWGLVVLLQTLSDVLIPFVLAFLVAYLINPLVVGVQKKIPNRMAALTITILGLLLALCALLAIAAPVIGSQMSETTRITRRVLMDQDISVSATSILPEPAWEAIRQVLKESNIQQLLHQQDVFQLARLAAEKALPGVWTVFSGAAALLGGILSLSVVLLYLIFILLDYETVSRECRELIPKEFREGTMNFFDEFSEAMNRYFRGQALIALCTGILLAIGFTIIDLPMGIVLGLLIGLLCMVPYLQMIGIIPAGILAILQALDQDSGIGMAVLFVLIVFAVVQVIQDAILTPKIMGKVTGLSPAIILLSISVWGKLLGFFGLIVAIPFTCLCFAWYKRLMKEAESK